MTHLGESGETVREIGKHIPFLRRYGRALSGNQTDGDEVAAATLDAIIQSSDAFTKAVPPKVALFSVFQDIWTESKKTIFVNEDQILQSEAQARLAKLTSGTRDVLLLNSLEQFSIEDISTIMKLDQLAIRDLLDEAYHDMADAVTGRILIIEDDAAIVGEIEGIVSEMGHLVTGNADTHTSAVKMALHDEPDLILADIVLADETSGVEATEEILETYAKKPVIFVTGHPELLLTGKKPEPAFLVTKPHLQDQLRTAVSQALFFRSSDAVEALDKS